ncbi:hypothetical protein EZS27_018393 [termite gut metagenome]|uniref:Uncharacterized protein n=1 Tax=termite gut metagenome TaxID=433724 RepID=A0A5J4RGD5_9ZZZZ
MQDEELIVYDILDKLKSSVPDVDKKIVLRNDEVIIGNFNFFDFEGLPSVLKTYKFDIIEMKKDSITVKKKDNIIYFSPKD